MTDAGWYDSPDRVGARWWSSDGWAETSVPNQASRLRQSRTALLLAAGSLCILGTLLAGPQAFGIVMANFDEQVVDAHAALLGLVGFAAVSWTLFIVSIVLHRTPRSYRRWNLTTYLLLAVIGIEIASVAGVTERIGLVFFS